MASIREQIQDGQHLANQAIKKILSDIDTLDKKAIALATYKEQLLADIDKHLKTK